MKTPLSEMPMEGVFTNDLRNELIKNNCDLIIHSWKDLPLDVGNQTEVAITLDRADPRDLFLLKKIVSKKLMRIIQFQFFPHRLDDSII